MSAVPPHFWGIAMLKLLHRARKRIIEEEMLSRLQEGIDVLFRVLPSAKQDLKGERALVDFGKAKRIDGTSMRHLTSHPQYVHSGEGFCPIRPEKILSLFSVEAKDTYENRFLMTLIRRLASFIEQRYELASKNANGEWIILYAGEKEGMEFYCRGRKYYEDDSMLLLAKLRENAIALLHSPFAHALSAYEEVYAPIHPTNLLTKNPDYRSCLEFFEYMEQKKELGISFCYIEEELPMDDTLLAPLSEIRKAIAAYPIPAFSSLATEDEDDFHVLFSLEEACLHEGKVLYSFFPDQSNDDPATIPLEEAQKARKRMLKLIQRQKKMQSKVADAVLQVKDKSVLEAMAKRRRSKP